jgi:hypothetical protein
MLLKITKTMDCDALIYIVIVIYQERYIIYVINVYEYIMKLLFINNNKAEINKDTAIVRYAVQPSIMHALLLFSLQIY